MVGKLRRRRRVLIAANTALATGVVACIYAFATVPLVAGRAADRTPGQTAAGRGPGQSPVDSLSAYAVIHQRDLRKPLFDPKPAPPPVKRPKPKPRLTVHLMGTVLEPGFTYAILKSASGKTQFVGVGQSFQGAEVTAIAENSATVTYRGQSVTLKIQQKEARR